MSVQTSPPQPSSSSSSSFVDAILDSLWQPGLNSPMRQAMNMSFYGLFLVLFVMLFLTSFNIHVVFLFCLSVALFLSIHWFLTELDKLPPSATQVQQMPNSTDDERANASQSTAPSAALDKQRRKDV